MTVGEIGSASSQLSHRPCLPGLLVFELAGFQFPMCLPLCSPLPRDPVGTFLSSLEHQTMYSFVWEHCLLRLVA